MKAAILNLWPYPLRNENEIFITTPKVISSITPLERFTGVEVQPDPNNHHTFGCPVYALHNTLQSGTSSIPKWDQRVRLGINLGHSPRHTRTISLVLSLTTGLVSPQFHVTHAKFFETVRPSAGNPPTPSLWKTLAGCRGAKISTTHLPELSVPTVPSSNFQPNESINIPTDPFSNAETEPFIPPLDTEEIVQGAQNSVASRVGNRVRRQTQRMIESREQEHFQFSTYYKCMNERDYEIQDSMYGPIVFKASTDPDILYYHQAMTTDDPDQFIEAMVREIDDHCELRHWELIPREQVPEGQNILDSV